MQLETRNTLDCDQSNYSSRIVFSHIPIEFGQTGIAPFDPPTPKIPTLNQTHSESDDPPWRYRHLNFSRWRRSRHIGFGETRNRAIRSADLENPTVEPNMKWIGRPLEEIWPFEIFRNVTSSVAGRSVLLTLISYTPLRYVRNVAREE